MAIILEGPDAAGKTTFGLKLKDLGFELIASGGAPTTEVQLIEYCEIQLSHCGKRGTVLDRISPISHPIYNPYYRGSKLMSEWLQKMLNHQDTLIVYCRPQTEVMMRPEKHQWKDYDTEEHKQKILDNQMKFIELYDEFFDGIPHLSYDYTHESSATALLNLITRSRDDDQILADLRRISRPYKVPA